MCVPAKACHFAPYPVPPGLLHNGVLKAETKSSTKQQSRKKNKKKKTRWVVRDVLRLGGGGVSGHTLWYLSRLACAVCLCTKNVPDWVTVLCVTVWGAKVAFDWMTGNDFVLVFLWSWVELWEHGSECWCVRAREPGYGLPPDVSTGPFWAFICHKGYSPFRGGDGNLFLNERSFFWCLVQLINVQCVK